MDIILYIKTLVQLNNKQFFQATENNNMKNEKKKKIQQYVYSS